MAIPPLGHTRCYWALLNANLQLLFLDPVLENHLKEQAPRIIGTSLLDWVHPDERRNASVDLYDVVQKQAVHGTVTRVKLVRASQIRVFLGASVKDTFPHARQVGFDDHYIPCDVAVNWVSDNLVLCFMHAVIDVSPGRDNDESLKSHWTNWCGTVALDKEHASLLYERLVKADHYCPPHPQFSYPTHLACSPGLSSNPNPQRLKESSPSPRRIFQILLNTPQASARKLLFSWPNEQSPGDFAKIAQDVDMVPQNGETSPSPMSGGDNLDDLSTENGDSGELLRARTSCTRRFASHQKIQTGGMNKTVESIFIPHGGVIFTCHVVVEEKPIVVPSRFGMGMGVYLNPSNITLQPPPPVPPAPQVAVPMPQYPLIGYRPAPPTVTHVIEESQYPFTSVAPASTLLTSSQDYVVAPTGRLPRAGGTVDWTSTTQSRFQRPDFDIAPYPRNGNNNDASHPDPCSPSLSSSSVSSSSSSHSPGHKSGGLPLVRPSHGTYHPSLSTQQQHQQSNGTGSPGKADPAYSSPWLTTLDSASNTKGDVKFAPISSGSLHSQPHHSHNTRGSYGQGMINHTTSTNSSNGGGRGGNPPNGVTRCAFCGTTSSPEWRKGTTGIKNLCNACGLRYARTKQKEEGYIPSRRRPTNSHGSQAPNNAASPTAPAAGAASTNGGGSNKVAKRAEGMTPRGTLVEQEAAKALEDALAGASAVPGVTSRAVSSSYSQQQQQQQFQEMVGRGNSDLHALSPVSESRIPGNGNGLRLPPISSLEASRDN